MNKSVGAVLAGAVAAGCLVAAPSAAAAKPSCAVGEWEMLSAKKKVTDSRGKKKRTWVWQGGRGTRLTLTAKRSSYDFSRSADVTYKGPVITPTVSRYRKTLKVASILKGDRTGSLWTKERSAKGNATVTVKELPPGLFDFGTSSVAKTLRRGEPVLPVVSAAKFTCSAERLVFTTRVSDMGSRPTKVKGTIKLVFKRVSRR